MKPTTSDEKPVVAAQETHVLLMKEKPRAAFELTVGRPATEKETEELRRLREELSGPAESSATKQPGLIMTKAIMLAAFERVHGHTPSPDQVERLWKLCAEFGTTPE